jgi:hypothetical protein
VTFIAYPHEVDVVDHQLNGFYRTASLGGQSSRRNEITAKICGDSLNARELGVEHPPFVLQLDRPNIPKAKPAKAQSIKGGDLKGLAQLGRELQQREAEQAVDISLVSSWRSDTSGEATPEEIEDGLSGLDGDTPCYRALVRTEKGNERIVFLPVHRAIEFMSSSRNTGLTLGSPAELGPGDVLLRLDEGGRADLFDRIVELAENEPGLAFLGRFRSEWQRAIQAFASKYSSNRVVDYGRALRALQDNGARIVSPLTVRNWVENFVIGPEDIDSIVAVGRATHIGSLERNAKEFDRVFRRIRGLHQGLGRRLSSAIRERFRSVTGDALDSKTPGEDEDLDLRLGIPLDEMLETIEFLEIVQISPPSGIAV